MLSIREVESRVRQLAAELGAPDNLLPTFGYPDGSGRPNVELNGAGYDYVVSERGYEHRRSMAADLDQLLCWIFSGITFDMAGRYAAAHSQPGEDFRRLLFAHQLELLDTLNPEWAELQRREQQAILARDPFRDQPRA